MNSNLSIRNVSKSEVSGFDQGKVIEELPGARTDAIKNLIKYVEQHQGVDPLIIGFDEVSMQNPLKRKKINKCDII